MAIEPPENLVEDLVGQERIDQVSPSHLRFRHRGRRRRSETAAEFRGGGDGEECERPEIGWV